MPMSLPRQRPVRAGVARDRSLTIKVTPAEMAAIGAAARAAGVYAPSEWMRRVVLAAAGAAPAKVKRRRCGTSAGRPPNCVGSAARGPDYCTCNDAVIDG